MDRVIETLAKIIAYASIFMLLFWLLVSTLPYAFSKKLSEESKIKISATNFYGENKGPDKVVLMETTKESFNARIELIRNAKETLDISYHTVQSGESTDAIMGEILNAADRGVEIRFLLDGKTGAMSGSVRDMIDLLNSRNNVTFIMYNTVHLLKPWEWHTLLHDKFIISDKELVILGGRNLGDRYFAPASYTGKVTNDRDVLIWNEADSDESGVYQVFDYMELVCNSSYVVEYDKKKVDEEQESLLKKTAIDFEKANGDFYVETLDDIKARTVDSKKVTLIYNPIHTNIKEPIVGGYLKEAALSATESVYLQTPYATANKELLKAMEEIDETAELTMLTNSVASSPNFPAFSNYYSQRKKFIKTGASIFEFQSEHSIHGKSVIIDDRLCGIGSYNMDDRSFYIDTETMLMIDSEGLAEQLKEAMDGYKVQSLKVGKDNKYEVNPYVDIEPVSNVKLFMMRVVSIFSRLFQFLI